MASAGAAGHVIPMFELAKALNKNHNVTFITGPGAMRYISLDELPNKSAFRMVYLNYSAEAVNYEKEREKQIIQYFMTHSIIDALNFLIPFIQRDMNVMLTKAVQELMTHKYDAIIGTSLTFSLNLLCREARAACVMLLAEYPLLELDFNMPDGLSLLSPNQITEFKYRLYNFVFNLRLAVPLLKTRINLYRTILQSLPHIPDPFAQALIPQNVLFTKHEVLKLVSLPPTLYPPSTITHDMKYVGGFVDDSLIEQPDEEFKNWLQSKPLHSIIYVAFGSISILEPTRMKNLMNGLAEFLLQKADSSAILAFRHKNFEHYQNFLNEMNHEEYRRVLTDPQRLKVENRFLPQKWILKQSSISLFISHCGMGSTVEALHFEKPILCIPLCTDQFANAMAVSHSGAGESLFQPQFNLKSLLYPLQHHDYTFSTDDVTTKLIKLWENVSYRTTARSMSLEMKHAGGVMGAAELIELLVNTNSTIARYEPFPHRLPFYQRYLLDVIFVCIVLPTIIIRQLLKKCCKRNRKDKQE